MACTLSLSTLHRCCCLRHNKRLRTLFLPLPASEREAKSRQVKVRVGEDQRIPPQQQDLPTMINLLLHLLLLLVLLLVPLTSCTSHHPPILQLATLCEGGGGKVVLGPSPVLLSFSGTSGLGTCHLQVKLENIQSQMAHLDEDLIRNGRYSHLIVLE